MRQVFIKLKNNVLSSPEGGQLDFGVQHQTEGGFYCVERGTFGSYTVVLLDESQNVVWSGTTRDGRYRLEDTGITAIDSELTQLCTFVHDMTRQSPSFDPGVKVHVVMVNDGSGVLNQRTAASSLTNYRTDGTWKRHKLMKKGRIVGMCKRPVDATYFVRVTERQQGKITKLYVATLPGYDRLRLAHDLLTLT